MYQEKLTYIINNHYRVLKKLIKKIIQDFDMEDIHQFRVEFKKLRALTRMLSLQTNAAAEIKISKKLRKCYKILGAIRELQLQHQQITKATQQDKIKPAGYLQFLQEKTDKLKPRLLKINSKKAITESKRKTARFIPHCFLLIGFNNFKKEKWRTVEGIIRLRDFSDDNLHAIRKNLKDLFYNLKMYEAAENRKLLTGIRKGKNESWLVKLIDDLGNHQDKRIVIALLKPLVISNTGKRGQLNRIKKTWTKEKAEMKLLLVKQLTESIIPRPKLSSENKLPHIG